MVQTREFFLEKLRRWDNLYFNQGDPEVSDTEYDVLKTSFKKLYPDDPYFKEVGSPIIQKYEEIEIPFIMGGLDEFNPDTVMSWINKKKDLIIASEKLDGNSIGCSWENGILSFAASRGDGKIGQNILNKGKYFIPTIPVKNKVSLRGEILLEGDKYKALGFKNRRNGVTGLLRRDEINPDNLKQLSVIFYELIEPEFNTEIERILYIQNTLKLKVATWGSFPPDKITDLPGTFSKLLLSLKEDANYDIDGLVLTYNNSKRENVEYPKGKIKFKVNQSAIQCEVKRIEWNVTRLGFIKPVVLIEPTEIMGVTVSRCSGFNVDFIDSHQIDIGSSVGVVRSGDVIPYITEVFKAADTMNIPINCPSCKSILRRTDKELICDNNKCLQKMIYTVSHFFIEMGTDNISDRTIEMLGVYSIEDAYNLTIEDMEKLPGFGKKKAEIIYNEIRKTLTIKPEKLLAAFGMPLIGSTLSKSLMTKFTLDELFEIKDPEVLGLGPITSKALIDNIGKYKPLYEFLKEIGLKFIKEDISLKTLKGMEFALTGAGPLKRKEYISMCEEKGGTIKGISKNTNYLVTDDVSTNSEKIKAANKFGTHIITYDEFMKMLT